MLTALSPRITVPSNCDCCVMSDELISFNTSIQDIALASLKAHRHRDSLLLTIHIPTNCHKQ